MLTWSEFEHVDLRVGTVVRAQVFLEAKKPAYKIWVDFGVDIGIRKSSAQITHHYTPEDLI
jgi:tRNA-binding protein